MKIKVDSQACNNARDCRLCLDRWPEKLFGTYPRKRREHGWQRATGPTFQSMLRNARGAGSV
ncbi:MAG: hypothetical protein M1570_05690 [Chloroflexi bacterium]|nr:hypothetical protein [Chloroflexota bacterium]